MDRIEVLYNVLDALKTSQCTFEIDVDQNLTGNRNYVIYIYATKYAKSYYELLFCNGRRCDFFITVNNDGGVWITFNENNLPAKEVPANLKSKASSLSQNNYSSPEWNNRIGKGQLYRIKYQPNDFSYKTDVMYL